MNQTLMEELKNKIKPALEEEVVYLNDRQQEFDKINEAFKSLSSKNVKLLIDKANYRMESLVIAHRFSNVASQKEVESNTSELNQIVSDLNNEILDIENIGNEMGSSFKEEKYKNFANDINSIIERTLNDCNTAVKKATNVLNHQFEAAEEEVFGVQETTDELKEELIKENQKDRELEVDEITPTEIKTDSIDAIEKELDKELEPIQEDKKDLEETKQNLDGAELVTSVEPALEQNIAPVLMPQENPDLDAFLSQGPTVEEKVETPVVEEPKEVRKEVNSAASVDEGFVQVTGVETFGLEETQNQEGPVLSRTA